MAKMTLPSANLDLTLTAGRQKAMIDAATGKKTDYIVRVDQLRVLPGFNVRVRETDDYRKHVESLKQSIRENGYYPNKPLAGYIAKDGDDDVIYVTDGHTRLEAVQEINAEDVDGTQSIEAVPIILKSAESTVADLTIALVQDNTGRPLTPYEMGVVVQRLSNLRDPAKENAPMFSKTDIARRLSITERYIDDLALLVGAPAKVRNAVLEGAIASTLAIQELRRDPKKAEERLTAAVAKAKASGKSKATKKDVGAVRMQTIRHDVSLATGDSIKDALKALAAKVREIVGHDGEDSLTTDGKISLAIVVPAPEKAPKAPAKPKKAATKKQSVQKPSKANGGVGGDPVAAKSKPEVTSNDDDDGEPVKLPPAVPTVEGGDPNDI